MTVSNCPGFPDNCGALQPDPDITGIGVFLSFLATALLTLIAAVLRLPCQFLLNHPHPRPHTFTHPSSLKHPSSIYQSAKENLRYYRLVLLKAMNNSPSHSTYRLLNATLVPLILSLADQQLVTSFALLIAALKDWEQITAYHYNIVVYLAWFSSFTHTVALVSLNDYFQSNRGLAILRLLGYVANFALFCVAQGRARSFGNTGGLFMGEGNINMGAEGAACAAQCAAEIRYVGNLHHFRIAVMTILFIQAILHWFPQEWRTRFSMGVYGKCLDILCISSQDRLGIWLAYVFQVIIVGFWVIPVVCVILGLAFGVSGAIQLRDPGNYPGLQFADNFLMVQNAWTFGQLVTCILLILPVLAALEGYLEEREKIKIEEMTSGRAKPARKSIWKRLVIAILKATHLWHRPANSTHDQGLLSRFIFWLQDSRQEDPTPGSDAETHEGRSSMELSPLPQTHMRQKSLSFSSSAELHRYSR